ncbi:MAG TPA: hypothetical protein ENJ80_11160 [Gammaproteobacteria bacterium]|nr:hypothetical protein [Gammaproteobacteria bacterium]
MSNVLMPQPDLSGAMASGLRLRLDGGVSQMSEDTLLPKWDGEDVFEGMLIFAAQENPADFSEWLRLTSLVCNQYRRCARAHTLSQNGTRKNTGST